MVRRHCPERSVIVETDDPRAAERFAALSQVDAVSRHGPELVVRGHGDDLITAVIHCLAEHQIRVADFRTELPTLEDVFLKLTGHTIRS